jgi:hypothetical protein
VFVLVIRDSQIVRECLDRQRPFGKTDWQAEMAATLDSEPHYDHAVGRGMRRKVACPLYYP